MKYKKKEPEEKFAPPVLTVDYEKYAHFLEDADLTEDQKREFLQAVWSIIVGFVDLGFSVHPLQQACGQVLDQGEKPTLSARDSVYSERQLLIEEFVKNADLETEAAPEGVKV